MNFTFSRGDSQKKLIEEFKRLYDMMSNNFTVPSLIRNSTRIYQCKFGCHYFDQFSNTYDQIHKPLSLLICIFGAGANCINLIVLTRRGMVTATNILLTGLSAAQLFLLSNYLSLTFYNYFAENCFYPNMLSSYTWTTYKWVNVNLNVAFHSTALIHTLFLALFRFLAIKRPHYSRKYLDFTMARRCVVLLHTVIPFLCFPTFLTTYVGKIILKKNEECCGIRDYYFDLKYVNNPRILQTTLWIYGVVFKLVPSISISLLSFYLIRSLKNMDMKRNRLTRKENVKRKVFRMKLSKMFIVVALLCVFVELPHGILSLMTAVFGRQFAREVYDNLGDFFEMLTLLYSSVNFVLYCLMNRGYQQTLKNLMYSVCSRSVCRKYHKDLTADSGLVNKVDSEVNLNTVRKNKWTLSEITEDLL